MHALFLLLALSADPRAVIGGDETVVVGQMAEVTADESVGAKSYTWIVKPKPLSMKRANKDGSVLYISHDKPEIFDITLVVASADGAQDVTSAELEIKATVQQQAEVAPAPVMQHAMVPPTMPTAAMMGHMPQNPANAVTWPQGVKVLAERVRSGTRKSEGVIVAGSFRSVANRIKTGTLASGDPWAEVQAQAREALGGAYGPWGAFFLELGELVGGLKQQGRLPNPQASVLLLESAADTLGSL